MEASAQQRQNADAFIRRFVDLINAHDLDGIASCYGDDPVEFSPVLGEIRGREASRNAWARVFELCPDWHVDLDRVLQAEEDRIIFTGISSGTDHNGFFGQNPTHERFEYRSFVIVDLKDGKIVRSERIYDLSGVLRNFEKSRLDKEIQMAAEVQRALLSRTERTTKFCDAAGDSLPCRSIGGDFFEFIPLKSGDFGIVLGDVSGKGPAAALLAATIQGMISIEAQSGRTPAQVLATLNESLLRLNLQPRFATLVYGVLSSKGKFTYSNAAQNPPILLSDGVATPLTVGGCLLGAFPGFDFPEETIQLNEGDAIIIYSDGLTEAENSDGEAFSDAHLEEVIAEKQDATASAIVRSVFRAVREHTRASNFTDDATMAVVKYGTQDSE